jgi:brevican
MQTMTREGRADYSAFHQHFPPATDSAHPSAIPEASNPASDPASDGLEAIVTVTETLQELQLPQEAMENESRGAIYSIPIMEDGGGGSSTLEDPAEAPRTLLGNSNPLL